MIAQSGELVTSGHSSRATFTWLAASTVWQVREGM